MSGAKPLPKYLYKYRSVRDGDDKQRTFDIIENHRLYFSKASDFNDPFDCVPFIDRNLKRSDIDKWVNKMLKKRTVGNRNARRIVANAERYSKVVNRIRTPDEVQQIVANVVKGVVDRVGILSLSEINDDILMWSHYADSHKGICLRFNVEKSPGHFAKAQKVFYRNVRPAFNFIKDEDAKQVEDINLTKAINWAYEKEWRFLDHIRGSGRHPFNAKALDGIIFGANIPTDKKSELIDLVKKLYPSIECFQATPNRHSFNLDITPI